MSSQWTPDDLPDMQGRTVIVTGGGRGIGAAVAQALGTAGAHVVLAVRDVDAGRRAARDMAGEPEVRRLDLGDLASVRAFAAGWSGPVDVLVNNAGVMLVPEGRTADGFELHLGINHLGHFALTTLLLPHVRGRVVTVSSGAHRSARHAVDPVGDERSYSRVRAYGQSKLANLLFTAQLQRRLDEVGSPVLSLASHPGYATTDLSARRTGRVERTLMRLGNRLLAQSPEHGAWPTLYAVAAELPGGAYVGPGGPGQLRGHPREVPRSAVAEDAEAAETLWRLSEELTGTGPVQPASGPTGQDRR